MPELPEVETIRAGLGLLLPGKQIKSENHNWAKSFPDAAAAVRRFLVGAEVKNVRRRAKVLIIDLDTEYSLVIHLKMTGQLVYRSKVEHFGAGHPSDSLVGDLPDKSTRVTLTFADGSKLFFNDQRKFGWMRLMPTIAIEQLNFFKKVGPEPLSADFSLQDLNARLERRPNSSIKAVLLDQTVVAGIGNIYADEILWAAKIHPLTKTSALSGTDIAKLYDVIPKVLELAIKNGGTTFRKYVNAEGGVGSYTKLAKVFRREGKPCPRCGTTIVKTRVAGRGTHICPNCQKVKS